MEVTNLWHIDVTNGSDYLSEKNTETMQDCVRLCLQYNIDNDFDDYYESGACMYGSWKKASNMCKLIEFASRDIISFDNAEYVGFELF